MKKADRASTSLMPEKVGKFNCTVLRVLRQWRGTHAGVHPRPLIPVMIVETRNVTQFWMHGGEVVVLHEVLCHQLPIGLDFVSLTTHQDEFV